MGSVRPLVATLAALGAVLSAPAAVHATTWTAPVPVTASGEGYGASQTVPLGLDGVVSVYQQVSTYSDIAARFAGPGGGFGDPQPLGGAGSFYPTLATDAAGEAIASWWNENDRSLRVAIGLRGEPFAPPTFARPTFAPPTVLASTSVGYSQEAPHLAVSPSGNAVVLFVASVGGEQRVVTSYRPAGGEFGPEEVVAPAGDDAHGQLPRGVAVNDLGEVVAGYLEDGVAHVAVRSAGPLGRWQPPQALGGPTGGYSWDLPAVGIDATGGAVAVWQEGGDETNAATSIKAAFRPSGGPFGAAQDLGIESTDHEEPQLAVSALGEAILLARPVVQEQGGVGLEPLVVLSGTTGFRRFADPVAIDAPLLADGERLAMNAAGDAIITYEACCDGGQDRLRALRRAPLGPFGPAADIAPPTELAPGEPVYARGTADTRLDPFGNAAVSWVEGAPDPTGAPPPARPLLLSSDAVLRGTLGALIGPLLDTPVALVSAVVSAVAGPTGILDPAGASPVPGPNASVGAGSTGVPRGPSGPTPAVPVRSAATSSASRPAGGLLLAVRRARRAGRTRLSVRLGCPGACTVTFAAVLDVHGRATLPLPIARTVLAGGRPVTVPVALTVAGRRAIAHRRATFAVTATAVTPDGSVARAAAQAAL